MEIVCLDLEGVLIPEVWIAFAEKTGIDDLRATTRDIPDYNILMKQRLEILEKNNFLLKDIQAVISSLEPLPGAKAFLDWLREKFQLVILSDTFYEFSHPFMRKLEWPTLFCHKLLVDSRGRVLDYQLRQDDPKGTSVKAFKSLNYKVFAAGDSYNDISMLSEADTGILIHAPQNVINDFPQFNSVNSYEELKSILINLSDRKLV
ncbi:MAG: bifunctional phosphoserine phosphatase/homoserine phosphotransferase ThrH [Alphaproteobacteria bacterium TMED87]|nr:bifunctional phosphoserine phosphatase/homoserine phosphotransferase ThrH [Rhodospirillaceae bacterium]OUV09145.1 MAG: bifunctional phosphoserine phosphatase/homoserine phosphotransferase ThrH [Alphaproteobacteria bacterium TMED87]